MEINAGRYRELRESLESELAHESAKGGFSQKERVRWLASRLSEYVERLLGFCAIAEASMSSLLNSVLFLTVQVGADVVSQELQDPRTPSEVVDAWKRFTNSLVLARTWTEVSQMQRIRSELASWTSRLSTSMDW